MDNEKMKLAYFSCLSPLKSGISDYSEKELLPYLSKYADIDIYIDDGYKPSNKDILNKFNIFHYGKIVDKINQYDAIIYHMGNNPFHIYMYETLMKYSGVVVYHDMFLHGLISSMTIGKGNKKRYVDEFKYCYGNRGKLVAEGAIKSGSYPEFEYPLLKRMLDNSSGAITHSTFGKNIILEEKKDINIMKINQAITVYKDLDKVATRKKLGIDNNSIIVATFGYVYPHKRIHKAIAAFARFNKKFPNSKYFLVGERSCDCTDLDRSIHKLGVKKSVIFTGFIPFERAMEYIAISDICINLRYPTAGETSSGTLRTLSMGKPTIVSNVGWFSELPDSCCIKIDVDKYEEETIFESLNVLASNERLRIKMGENAREYILKECDPEKIAKEYCSFISNIKGKRQYTLVIKEISYDMADVGIKETDDTIIKDIAVILKDLDIVNI